MDLKSKQSQKNQHIPFGTEQPSPFLIFKQHINHRNRSPKKAVTESQINSKALSTAISGEGVP